MSANVYPVPGDIKKNALIDKAKYDAMYKQSVEDPEGFWGEHGKRIDWIKPYSTVKNVSYDAKDLYIKWYEDGTLNVAANCLDRHLEKRGDQTAIIFEGDDPNVSEHITYRDLYERTCRFANALKTMGVAKGDRVVIYLPMIPEAAVAMLACARIGAIHSIVFGGFSPEALAGRVEDCGAKVVITSDEGLRGGRSIPLKRNADEALSHPGVKSVEKMVVVKHTGKDVAWNDARDVWYHEVCEAASTDCPPTEVNAEDPLFVLYTSGSTGKPKGVLHTSGGYLVYASMTHEYVFDYHEGDIYWCTADVGWVTGHSYIVYGPLANGATTLMFEGVPSYPDASRFWQVCEKHKVNIFYTAPTAIRALMREGESFVNKADLSSLRILGSVGEPINPEAWEWYYEHVGKKNCPIVDTWWQTETGGILITPLPGATDLKPGSATLPFFGVQPALLDNEGKELTGATDGNLVIKDSWPGQMRTVYGDHERFIQTYFSTFNNVYTTGDGARRDDDGYYWITGRVDDVINVSGHRMGTAEVESALVAHSKVAEAAVVGVPHDIKGQGIYAYVTLNAGEEPTDELRAELVKWVRKEIGPIASPDYIQWSPGLPKTRSGKIMRRILRKIAANEYDQLGDTSTLADPGVVDDLIDNRQNR
ncbi:MULTISPECIES: acetate--CoA ligase [Thalassospira]|jgi:acetyl-CoA synthetase|uniref:Acetyl-coenzyme A synthetase n=1 Tax=Thalassospira profundimaris TaxID=502049 RepID=A0A367VFJ6_9PROT|nr:MULTISPECIES: acetate--CoA ligase [Thalassospira]MBR9898514.1 acetate--CoA ligase [Rhodospirillales bacterium]KZB73608.1 acetyl-coenzyme A synthetase [Thalassospira sp. MCCC 1A01148]MBO6806814.1 acetate--CoA ligase [Thalassospira sp.]MBS8275339.1 acetate--CoA ligase [Thalassospira tepidiphila]RCK23945.1 acetyl-CoA synthetase [Thalassospira profundimaris]|tara:strand:- start:6229 stop:8172 length:1944 start_codon:yes stop_codon:yes gene_type:complete